MWAGAHPATPAPVSHRRQRAHGSAFASSNATCDAFFDLSASPRRSSKDAARLPRNEDPLALCLVAVAALLAACAGAPARPRRSGRAERAAEPSGAVILVAPTAADRGLGQARRARGKAQPRRGIQLPRSGTARSGSAEDGEGRGRLRARPIQPGGAARPCPSRRAERADEEAWLPRFGPMVGASSMRTNLGASGPEAQ